MRGCIVQNAGKSVFLERGNGNQCDFFGNGIIMKMGFLLRWISIFVSLLGLTGFVKAAPIGYLDIATTDRFAGWTCDPANPANQSADVHIWAYVHGVGWSFFRGLTPDVYREVAVANACGSNYPFHGFDFIPTFPSEYHGRNVTFYFFGLSSAANPLGAGEVTLFIPVPPPPPAATSVATVYGFNMRNTNHGDCATPRFSSESVYQGVAGAYVSNMTPCQLMTSGSLRNSNPFNDLQGLPAEYRTPFKNQQSVVEFEFKQELLAVTGPANFAQSHGTLDFCSSDGNYCFYYIMPSANIFNNSTEVMTFDGTPPKPVFSLTNAIAKSPEYGSVLGSGPVSAPGSGLVQFKFSISYQQFQRALNDLPNNYKNDPPNSWRLSNYHINNEVTGNVPTSAIFTSTKDAVLRIWQ